MNLARHHSVDIKSGKGLGPIQTVRNVSWGRHKYVSGSPVDPTSKYWSRILMWRVILVEGESDYKWDFTSWAGDLHWFLSILGGFFYFRDVYSLRTPSLRRSWPRNVVLTCFQLFFCQLRLTTLHQGWNSLYFALVKAVTQCCKVAKVQACGAKNPPGATTKTYLLRRREAPAPLIRDQDFKMN